MPGFDRTRSLEAGIEAYRPEFRARAASDLDLLRGIHAELEAAAPETVDEGTLFEIQRRAHKLAGRGGTFGYHDLSDTARKLELEMDRLIRAARPVTCSDIETIGVMIDGIGAAVLSVA